MDQLAGLPEGARKLALDRFRLIQPHVEDNRPLTSVAANAGIPFRTAQRWVSAYRQFGLARSEECGQITMTMQYMQNHDRAFPLDAVDDDVFLDRETV